MYHFLIFREPEEEEVEELESWQEEMRQASETTSESEVSVEPFELVSVKFNPRGRTYDYLCRRGQFRAGDTGIAPPSSFCPDEQRVTVVGTKSIAEARAWIRYKWLGNPERADLIEMK